MADPSTEAAILQRRGVPNSAENLNRLRTILASNPQMGEAAALGLHKTDDDSGQNMIDTVLARGDGQPQQGMSGISAPTEPSAVLPTVGQSTGTKVRNNPAVGGPSQMSDAERQAVTRQYTQPSQQPTDAAASSGFNLGDIASTLLPFLPAVLGIRAALPNLQGAPATATPPTAAPPRTVLPLTPQSPGQPPLTPAANTPSMPPTAAATPNLDNVRMFSGVTQPADAFKQMNQRLQRYSGMPGLSLDMQRSISGMGGLIAGGPSNSNLDQTQEFLKAYNQLPWSMQVRIAKDLQGSSLFTPEFSQAITPKQKVTAQPSVTGNKGTMGNKLPPEQAPQRSDSSKIPITENPGDKLKRVLKRAP